MDPLENEIRLRGHIESASYKEAKKRKTDNVSELGLVDVKNLEYGSRNLQKIIKMIINDAPDIMELKSIIHSYKYDEAFKSDLRESDLIKLLAKLKTKYKNGELKIFDSILNNDVEIRDYNYYNSIGDTNGRTVSEEESFSDSSDVKVNKSSSNVPLPEIKSQSLKDRVFLHKSIVNNLTYLEKAESINKHNERLEFLGDSVLNNIVTLMIYKRFPNASEGDLSKVRSLLVNNDVLTKFSIEYGFDKKLRSNINEAALRQGRQKIYADLFEAYIGALAIEHESDYGVIRDWLEALMGPKLDSFDKEYTNKESINKDAKSDLYSHIGSAQFHPEYEIIQQGDGASRSFIINCKMGNEILGTGEAPGHKEAGLRAAMAALKDKALMEKYSQLRQSLDRSETVVSAKAKNIMTKLTSDFSSSSPDETYSNVFPLKADIVEPLNLDAKNELYAVIFKYLGEPPEYFTEDVGDHKMKTELKIKGMTVATAIDTSKKKALSRAAMAILRNKQALAYFKRLAGK